MFVAGILLCENLGSLNVKAPSSISVLVLLGLAFFTVASAQDNPLLNILKISLLFFGFYGLCLLCFRSSVSPVSRFFAWSPMRWLGNMSYSYYLLHGLTLKASFLVLKKVMPMGGGGFGIFFCVMLIMFLLTLISAAFLFLLVEKPMSLRSGSD